MNQDDLLTPASERGHVLGPHNVAAGATPVRGG